MLSPFLCLKNRCATSIAGCKQRRYNLWYVKLHATNMIISFRHKGLEYFFTTGSTTGIQPAHAKKLANILIRLNSAQKPADMNFPGWNLHPLTGNLAGHWSVKVNGNWRVTFLLQNGHADIVDYQDYH